MLGDLEIARKHLASEGNTLVLAKNGEVIASSSGHGIVEFVRLVVEFGRSA